MAESVIYPNAGSYGNVTYYNAEESIVSYSKVVFGYTIPEEVTYANLISAIFTTNIYTMLGISQPIIISCMNENDWPWDELWETSVDTSPAGTTVATDTITDLNPKDIDITGDSTKGVKGVLNIPSRDLLVVVKTEITLQALNFLEFTRQGILGNAVLYNLLYWFPPSLALTYTEGGGGGGGDDSEWALDVPVQF